MLSWRFILLAGEDISAAICYALGKYWKIYQLNTKIYQNIYNYIQIYTRSTRYIQNTRRRPGGGGPARPRGARVYFDICWYQIDSFLLMFCRFWYGHHPKMHEMVSDRSSQAENWTDLRKISMCVLFGSKKRKTNRNNKHTHR